MSELGRYLTWQGDIALFVANLILRNDGIIRFCRKGGATSKNRPMSKPRNRVVQIRRFGDPDVIEVVDAPCRRPAPARYGSACSPRVWNTQT